MIVIVDIFGCNWPTFTDSSPPIRGGAAPQLLYCRAGIGYHLQILTNGAVGGVHKPDGHCEFSGSARFSDIEDSLIDLFCPGWLKVFAMKRGVVGIKGVKSNLYLCLSADGVARGAVRPAKTRHVTQISQTRARKSEDALHLDVCPLKNVGLTSVSEAGTYSGS